VNKKLSKNLEQMCKKLLLTKSQKTGKNAESASLSPPRSPCRGARRRHPDSQISGGGCSPPGARHHRSCSVLYGSPFAGLFSCFPFVFCFSFPIFLFPTFSLLIIRSFFHAPAFFCLFSF
jgi:hypothetical protein